MPELFLFSANNFTGHCLHFIFAVGLCYNINIFQTFIEFFVVVTVCYFLLLAYVIFVENVMCTDKSNDAVAEELDSRTSRPGPVGITFEIIDAQTVRDGDDKYVVGALCVVAKS